MNDKNRKDQAPSTLVYTHAYLVFGERFHDVVVCIYGGCQCRLRAPCFQSPLGIFSLARQKKRIEIKLKFEVCASARGEGTGEGGGGGGGGGVEDSMTIFHFKKRNDGREI